MTRIDFYILPESASAPDSVVITACRLCEKAVSAGKQVFVHATGATAEQFDTTLWSHRQGSFIAHERLVAGTTPSAPVPPVLIGAEEPPDSHHDILINLSEEVPDSFSRFERVLEIVAGVPEQRAAVRAHFRYYRDRGYPLNTFEQSESGAWRQRQG